MPTDVLTPLRFAPIFKPALWGGTRLAPCSAPPSDEPTGEAWVLSDVGNNSSVVADGPRAGPRSPPAHGARATADPRPGRRRPHPVSAALQVHPRPLPVVGPGPPDGCQGPRIGGASGYWKNRSLGRARSRAGRLLVHRPQPRRHHGPPASRYSIGKSRGTAVRARGAARRLHLPSRRHRARDRRRSPPIRGAADQRPDLSAL